jgi:hypothetical protein
VRVRFITSLAELRQLIEVVPVDRPVLITLVEEPLRFDAHARHRAAAQLADGKPGAIEPVIAAAQCCLPSTSMLIKQQRVQVDSSST